MNPEATAAPVAEAAGQEAAAAMLANNTVSNSAGTTFTTTSTSAPTQNAVLTTGTGISVPSFTQDDLVKARQEEKSKLYPEIERLKQENEAFKAQQEAAQKAEADRQAQIEAEEKRKQEEETDVRTLLQQKEAEWETKIEAERLERERAFALLEQERNFAQVQEYRAQRIEQERESILPELIDLVAGDSPDQIEASIAGLRERSDRILSSAQQAAQTARRDLSGARVTAPPAEPLDNYSGNKSFTPDQLRDMSMNEYAQYRQQLINESGGRGLFG